MGIKEYQHLRGTMLKVVDLSKERKDKEINISNLQTEMMQIEAKLNKKENELRKFKAKGTPKKINKAKEEIERLESEIESFERKLAYRKKADNFAFMLFFIGPIVSFMVFMPTDYFLHSCGLFFVLFIILTDLDSGEGVSEKITYRKRKLKEERSNIVTPRKLKNRENGISKLEEYAKKTKKKEQSLIQEMIDNEVEINELMDSVGHLIPYADQID